MIDKDLLQAVVNYELPRVGGKMFKLFETDGYSLFEIRGATDKDQNHDDNGNLLPVITDVTTGYMCYLVHELMSTGFQFGIEIPAHTKPDQVAGILGKAIRRIVDAGWAASIAAKELRDIVK